VAGAAFSKGHLLLNHHFFRAAIFVKKLLNGYLITCGYYGSAIFDINIEQFYSLHHAKGAK
jgi:hypothetical protein